MACAVSSFLAGVSAGCSAFSDPELYHLIDSEITSLVLRNEDDSDGVSLRS